MRVLPMALTSAMTPGVFPGVHRGAVEQGLARERVGDLAEHRAGEAFSATVVRMVETPKPAAQLATRAALLRRSSVVDRLGGESHLRLEVDHDQGMVGGLEQTSARGGGGLQGHCRGPSWVVEDRSRPPRVTDKDTLPRRIIA
jgi:hypothetical protein